MIKHFTYTKPNGEASTRAVVVLREPTDMMLALDLTEFSEAEQAVYEEEVEEAQLMFKETINNIGLGSQYRCFKKKGITYNETT